MARDSWRMIFGLRMAIGHCLAMSTLAPAAEYFVAPDGADENPGSKEKPFATLQRAQQAAEPGDTVVMRGGTYKIREALIARQNRLYAYVIDLHKSGRSDAPITYQAAKGEQPVFDFSEVKPPNRRVAAFYVPGSWIRLQGLEVIGVQVTIRRHTQSICFYNDGSHNVFERLSMHDGQAIGIYSVRGSHNLFLNCDAYRNHDSTSENGRGGNVDGFGCHPWPGAVGNVFRGCRAWLNSDDGFDLITSSEAVTLENCWAFWNGRSAYGQRLGDGNGFKAGGYGTLPAGELPRAIPRHVIRFCLAVENPSSGFYANHHPGGCDWLHNSAFRNGTNFNFLSRLSDNVTDVPGVSHVIINNLSFQGRRQVANVNVEKCQMKQNFFGDPQLPTSADFQSLEVAELLKPRQRDGRLPQISFLHLVPKSRLIDQGAPTGAPFRGHGPEPGAFEK